MVSPSNNKLQRAKSEISNLLGEKDVFRSRIDNNKKSIKETGRIFRMKAEVNQILNRNYRNIKSSLDNNDNIILYSLFDSTNEFISKTKIEKNKKKQMKDDNCYAKEITFGYCNRRKANINNYSNGYIGDNDRSHPNLKVKIEMTKI